MKWLKRAGWTAAIIAVLYVVAGVGGIAVVTGWLLTPGSVDWSGAGKPAPESPFEIGYRGDPQQAFGYPFETVAYPGPLGDAPGWMVPGDAGSTLWAVYVHGIGGIRENGYRQLSVLHEAGIPTLMITYRNDAGAPAGEPPFYSFGLTEWSDLDAAITWMVGQGAERIVLVAESMGGAIAGQFLMRSQQTDRIVALALDAPVLDFPAVVGAPLEKRFLPFASTLAGLGIRGITMMHGIDLGEAVSFDVVRDFPRPIFLAHGMADSLVPVATSERLAAERKGPTTFLRTEADHLLSWKEDPGRYRAELLRFLEALKAK